MIRRYKRANRLGIFTIYLFLLFLASGATPPRLTVYTFLSTECPISQRYVRTLVDLHQHFAPSNIQFVAIFPLPSDSPQVIKRFRADYKLSFSGHPDADAQLARHFRIRVTPEVVVMQADGRIVYQGAIDDWYVGLGKNRAEPSRRYLHDALDALAMGQAVAHARTDAVGCLVE